ncbi:phosphate ABC transporter substrate-binding protein [Sphingomonas sp. Root710]|uniref:substrate-binding domain-containing protein n=1 Tax=Sphingomonas sp. Root710 TaxID=1736594 RepID=UPI0006FC78BD|nr:substrate-binding domain-containing protein [Sphingomonas sp. Root710]KRB86009.1 phosphate ABC transporter substrate-binding protein [Sphingomonas sp. Root710]
MKRAAIILGVAGVILAGCNSGGGSGGSSQAARTQIRAVGSSTVYPFTTAVAEQFVRKFPAFKAPVIESTGTGAGMKLFCAGVGAQHPDIESASRRIKASEAETCRKNGVDKIIELEIGIDGLALAESKAGPALKLTQQQVYEALAATPYGKPNTAKTWKDIDPSLPAIAIRVYGPPPTSGTRDSFNELIMDKGCNANAEMAALKKSDEARHKEVCTKVREDGAFVESGENDNLIVQKLIANPDAIGIFGYSFLEENAAKLRGVSLGGVEPTSATIADFSYPGARRMYVYVKQAHLNAIPGLKEFIAEYARGWEPGAYLSRRGLIPAPAETRAKSAAIAKDFTLLDLSTIE